MSNITEWIKDELYPNLFERIDSAFPEHNFRRFAGGWRSNTYRNGDPHSRPDKTVITTKAPGVIFENGLGGMSIIDYVIDRDGIDFSDAIRKLSDLAGVDLPPMENTEAYQEYKKKSDILEDCDSYFIYCINNATSAKETLQYLNGRGYSDEDIKALGIGYIPSFEKLKDYLITIKGYSNQDVFKHLGIGPDTGIGSDYKLTIPYRSAGSIKGFKFRAITDDIKPKYKNTFGLDKSSSFFNLKSIKGDKDIILVEGELDALHATIKGIDNVVATGGNTVTQEQVLDAVRRGAKKFTICFDSDPGKENETVNKITSIIQVILDAGVNSIYIAELPNKTDKKVDVDSFLNNYGPNALQLVLDNSVSYYNYLLHNIMFKYRDLAMSNDNELLTDKQLESLQEEIVYTSLLIKDPIHKNIYKTTFLQFDPIKEVGITEDTLDIVLDDITYTKDKQEQEKQFKQLLKDANNVESTLGVDRAIQLLGDRLKHIQLTDKKTSFDKLLIPISESDITKELKANSEGLISGITIDGQDIEIPSGAISTIAAPTSHGKTTMLVNLALNLVREYQDKQFYFFTYEESKEAVMINALNAYTNDALSYNNRKSISSYFRDSTTEYISAHKRDSFIQHKEEFFRDLVDTGRLNIQYVNYDSDTLMEAIRYLKKTTNVGGIIIDYIQLLNLPEGKYKTYSRQEELKNICISLKDTAVETGLPIILGAQFNRKVTNHLQLHPTNIGEAGDIERIANLILGMWNNHFAPIGTAEELKEINRQMMHVPGSIYTKVLKYRSGQPGKFDNLKYDGNNYKIG